MKRTAPDARDARETSVAQVAAIYAELDQRPIERACTRLTECCQFKRTGKVPFLTRGEALVAARAWRATGRTHLPTRADGSCPMLDPQGRCLIYPARPFGCRTHFCPAAGGPYPRRDVVDLIRRLEEIDRQLDGDGSHPLPFAINRELRR